MRAANTLPPMPVPQAPELPPARKSSLSQWWEKARHGPVGKLGRTLLALLPLALLLAASRALWTELARLRWSEVSLELAALPPARVGLAVLATASSYLALTLYDVLALRYVGRRLPYSHVSRISFTACALGHSIGLSVLGSGSVRYRFYSNEGLTAREVARIAAFCALTFWTGLLFAGGLCVAWAPEGLALLHLPSLAARAVGVGLLLLAAGYVTLSARAHHHLPARGLLALLPPPRLALGQVLVSSVDWMMAALVLFLLLPPQAGLSLPELVALFVAAQALGVASQVPGGLGVFEFVMLAALSPRVPVPTVLGMLVAYRILYYLLPLALALALLIATRGDAPARGSPAADQRSACHPGAGGAPGGRCRVLRGRRGAALLGGHADSALAVGAAGSHRAPCRCWSCPTCSAASPAWRCCCWRWGSSAGWTGPSC